MATMDGGATPGRDATAEQRPIPTLFREAARQYGTHIALRWKRRGIWQATNWAEYATAAREVGCGLLALGLRRGERIAILSENRPEWLYVDVGAQAVGCVVAGIDVTEPPERVAAILNDCGARLLFVDSEWQLDTALAALVNVPKLERIVYFDESLRPPGRHLHADIEVFGAFRADGAKSLANDPARWEREADRAQSDDAASIVCKTGQTGSVKSALLTHRDIGLQTTAIARLCGSGIGDEQLSILPLAQVVERCFSVYRPLAAGSIVNFGEGAPVLLDSLREAAPHVVLAAPQTWEMLHATIVAAIADAVPIDRWGFRAAIDAGYARADRLLSDQRVSPLLQTKFFIARRLVLDRTRTMMGLQRARVLISVGAPMSRDLSRWFGALDLRTAEASGQTDCARENPR